MRVRGPLLLLLLLGCDDAPNDATPSDADLPPDAVLDAAERPDVSDSATPADAALDGPPLGPDGSLEWPAQVAVLVTLDDAPAADTLVMQGGTQTHVRTDADGRVMLPIDLATPGQVWAVASHPQARIRAMRVQPPVAEPVRIELARFGVDNPDYHFTDPGTRERRGTTAQCAHCHQTINDAWWSSVHSTAASNQRLHDLYAGTGAECETPREGRLPGGGVGPRCYVADGVLPTLNPETCGDGPCPDPARTGACADCHAPGIDGQLGGRDLLDADGFAYEGGVHCDVCHSVESVDLDATAPGVAGRLRILRPSTEAPVSLGAGGFLPLTFGPSHDSPNPRMGSVQRDHYRSGAICAGCHEYTQPALVPGTQLDPERWPDGRLPVHTTYGEWRAGVLADAMSCPDCHMPPDPLTSNGANLERFPLADIGVQGGWMRPAGSVRAHSWVGPRTLGARMLQLAAAVFVRSEVRDGRVHAQVTVRNAGAGHAIPTGEPLRALLLRVRAYCGDAELPAVGGDALPEWAGHVSGPPQPGDRLRVARHTGETHAYRGYGAFEHGQLPVTEVVGEATVVDVVDGQPVYDAPPPEGELRWLVRDARQLAGASGFAFARVMADAAGREMVPHFLATDVTSDNRLMPQQSFTSTHVFTTDCPDPQVHARLLYRPFPMALAAERGWDVRDETMVEVRR